MKLQHQKMIGSKTKSIMFTTPTILESLSHNVSRSALLHSKLHLKLPLNNRNTQISEYIDLAVQQHNTKNLYRRKQDF